jgi:hypothetical protein
VKSAHKPVTWTDTCRPSISLNKSSTPAAISRHIVHESTSQFNKGLNNKLVTTSVTCRIHLHVEHLSLSNVTLKNSDASKTISSIKAFRLPLSNGFPHPPVLPEDGGIFSLRNSMDFFNQGRCRKSRISVITITCLLSFSRRVRY